MHSRHILRRCCQLAVICAALVDLLAPQAASAETTAAPAAPVPVTAPAAAPVAIRLELQRVGGSPVFALEGTRIVVRGIVTPYVAGQTVTISFYRDGRKLSDQVASVL